MGRPQMYVKPPTSKVVKHCSQLTCLPSHSTLAKRNASCICPFPSFMTPKAVKAQQSMVKYISIFADVVHLLQWLLLTPLVIVD